MEKTNVWLNLAIIIVIGLIGFALVFPAYLDKAVGLAIPGLPNIPFKLGLDLQGGSHLVYQADLSKVAEKERSESMQGLRDVIERRVNIFGVAEPVVRIEKKGASHRLIVELPGVKKTEEAIKMIGKTPYLEFRKERTEAESREMLEKLKDSGREAKGAIPAELDPYFKATELTGKYLKKAGLSFNQNTMEPYVLLEFNSKGAEIFKRLTSENVGKRLAIYIDNVLISAPVVQEAIPSGKAQITGRFTVDEAKAMVRNFNAGALPVPIKLISQTTIGPVLGRISLNQSLKAALFGFLAVALFMIVFYRLAGLMAVLSLFVYGLILLSVFKLLPVTLTLAGIGGAILSVGMAVDANILIFERHKEELRAGESFSRALKIGFSRAWPSIRDSNFTTLLVALIMFSFGTSFVKGFALTLSLGIFTSLFSALFVTKTFLKLFIATRLENVRKLWG